MGMSCLKRRIHNGDVAYQQKTSFKFRLVHIPYNLPSLSSSEQLNTSQKAEAVLLTTFVNVCVVAGRSWTAAGHSQAVSRRPTLIHTCHALPLSHCALGLRSRFQNGMVRAQQGHSMVFFLFKSFINKHVPLQNSNTTC